MPAVNVDYLFYHPRYASRCTSTTSSMYQLPKSLQSTPQSNPKPTDPPCHLNNINNALTNYYKPIPTPIFQHPALPLIPLERHQNYPLPLNNNLNSRNFFLNWNNWGHLKLITVKPTKTWNILTAPPPKVTVIHEVILKTAGSRFQRSFFPIFNNNR